MAHFTIDRAKINPEWDAQTKLLYLWLCEEAAFAPHEWRGVMVEEGQYLTTLRSLAEVFNIPQSTLRRKLKNLIDYQSIKVLSIRAKDATNRVQNLTLITLVKARTYGTHDGTHDGTQVVHMKDCVSNSYTDLQIASGTHDGTHDGTTISEYNITEYNGCITSSSSPPTHAHTHERTRTREGEGVETAAEICRDLVKTIRTDQTSQYNIQSKSGISPYAAIEYVRDFANEIEMRGDKGERGRQLVLHFISWLQIRLRYEARKAAEDKRNKKLSSNGDPRQAARETAEALQRDFFQKFGGGAPTFDGIGATGDHLPNGGGFR